MAAQQESTGKGIAPIQKIISEHEELIRHLQRAETVFLGALEGVSRTQAEFRPGAERWSIGEVVEHVAVAEEFLLAMMRMASPSAQKSDPQIDERIHRGATNRTRKFTAPEKARPTGRFRTLDEAIAHFRTNRQNTVRYVEQFEGSLRNLRVLHPVAGSIDGHQFLLILAYHPERHAGQIEEIKGDSAYPR